MKRDELLENLKAAKGFTSVLLIEDMIKLIEALEPEVEVGITKELAEDISYRINACLEHNCRDLVDLDSADFDLNRDNQIKLTYAEIDTNLAIEHIDAVLDQFIIEAEAESMGVEEEMSGISDAEREQIAKELEDHLEEKLEEY